MGARSVIICAHAALGRCPMRVNSWNFPHSPGYFSPEDATGCFAPRRNCVIVARRGLDRVDPDE